MQNRLHEQSKVPSQIQSVSSFDSYSESIMKLGKWAIQHNITRNALSDSLKILVLFGLHWLPIDARTLLKTPSHTTNIVDVANGQRD